MELVLTPADFAAARAVSSIKLDELGVAPVCMAPGELNRWLSGDHKTNNDLRSEATE